MNCRTFQKNLEDYLENSLDFAGRFGMERHAQQCVRCGREMADAQRLSRLVRGLAKVKAPPNFESTVLNEIGKRKLRNRFPVFRRFLTFGFDMPSMQQVALAASIMLVLGAGFLVWRNLETVNPSHTSGMADAGAVESPAIESLEEDGIHSTANPMMPAGNAALSADGFVNTGAGEGRFVNYHADESDYREYRAIGPDNLPMIVPLPDRIHMQVAPPPEEYFIRNVSH